MNEKENGLSESPLFADISREKLSELGKVVKKEVVPAHEIVFRQGDPGDRFYVITSGKVRIFRKSKEDIETDLSRLGPGDSFGEMALLTGKDRSAYAEAVEETHFLVLAKDQFDGVLKNHPDVSLVFIKQMSDWLVRDELIIEKEAERQSQAPRVSWVDFLVIIAVSLLCGITFNLVNPNGINMVPISLAGEPISRVSLSMAIAKHKEGKSLFVDARPESFYEQGHIEGAVNVPAAIFDIMYVFELSEVDKVKDIIVYGKTFSSRYDEHVARKLILRSHNGTMILDAGLSVWKKKGYPVKP
jgi:rhodanese-related sulfurtransferase